MEPSHPCAALPQILLLFFSHGDLHLGVLHTDVAKVEVDYLQLTCSSMLL